MRPEGPGLKDEPAKRCSQADPLVEQEQFGRDFDASKENPRAIEEAQSLKPNGNRRQTQLPKPRRRTNVLFPVRIAEEL
jgi:hypothetical protein